MNKVLQVAQVSRWMANVSLGITVALPVASAALVFLDPQQVMSSEELARLGLTSLDQRHKIMLLVIAFILQLPFIWGLLQLRKLFRCYAAGEVFTPTTARYLSRFSQALLLDAACTSLGRTIRDLALTAQNPPGHHVLSFGIGSHEVITVFFGTTFLVIAWVMAEASSVAEENKSFV